MRCFVAPAFCWTGRQAFLRVFPARSSYAVDMSVREADVCRVIIDNNTKGRSIEMKRTLCFGLAVLLGLGCFTIAAAEAEKPVILVVSFGTSYNDSRDITIGAIEEDVQAAYSDYEVRRAFTSQIIIDRLKERDGLEIDNVTEAMDKLVQDGVKELYIQPTHVMKGFEYDDVVAEVAPYQDKFDVFKMGDPLLTHIEDYEAVTKALLSDNEFVGSEDTAIVYMGHGTEHSYNAAYSQMEAVMQARGYDNVFIGTVESFPTIEDVIAKVTAFGAEKVVLYPFMVVAGDHANNDMAGGEEDSWNTLLEEAGFEVECKIQGLGQNEGIRSIYVEHLKVAMEG